MDLCSRDIVGYSISDRPVLSVVTQMADDALSKIPDGTNFILHFDQGWPYQRILKTKGIQQSVRHKGNGLDNAFIESLFDLLKSELLHWQKFALEHFKAELIACLDYCNNCLYKAKRKGLPPAIRRQQALSAA